MKEKSPQEKNAAERQASLITEALSKSADNKGVWLNEQGKQYPSNPQLPPSTSFLRVHVLSY